MTNDDPDREDERPPRLRKSTEASVERQEQSPNPDIVRGTPEGLLLSMLEARAGKSPVEQRKIFVKECASCDMRSQLVAAMTSIAGPVATIVSANCYYGRCTNPLTSENFIDPGRTFRAVKSLLDSGADAVCMQEVIGGALPNGQGKDTYPFEFFPKQDFAEWPLEAEKFAACKNIRYVYAPAKNSAMYRQSFGNAIAINTETLRVVDLCTQACLTEPTEVEGGEGRSAVAVLVEHIVGGHRFAICCTHLTEKQIGEAGQKQCEMIDALLQGILAQKPFNEHPVVLCGDFNINNVDDQPVSCAEFCKTSSFLHPHPSYNPYERLGAAGFKSGQSYAKRGGQVLNTCWNAACVDYIGVRGDVVPTLYSVLDPQHDGMVLSDHRWPVGVYRAKS